MVTKFINQWFTAFHTNKYQGRRILMSNSKHLVVHDEHTAIRNVPNGTTWKSYYIHAWRYNATYMHGDIAPHALIYRTTCMDIS